MKINDQIIADHTGKDADVFHPELQSGGVMFTDGPDIGHEVIDKILSVIYPDLSTHKLSREFARFERRNTGV